MKTLSFLLVILTLSFTVAMADPVATIGQVFMGPLSGGMNASTNILVTNRSLNPCDLEIFFHQGPQIPQNPIMFDGQNLGAPFIRFSIPRGGVRDVKLTSDTLVTGIGSVFNRSSNCDGTSYSISASYSLFSASSGLVETFSIRARGPDDWLRKDRCVAISRAQDPGGHGGTRHDLGVAVSSVVPGTAPPSGTFLEIGMFDQNGNSTGQSRTFPLDGRDAFFPLDQTTRGAVTGVFCLRTSDPNYRADLTGVGLNQRGENVQYDTIIFADGFESGDTSAWSN